MIWTIRPRSEAPGGLAWVRAGAGAPVVVIHGVGLRAEAWGAQFEALSKAHAVHAIDLPGHGESPPLAGEPALADFTDRIATAIATLGAPATIVGHSMGAMIALDLAARYPELCRGVAALNAVYRRSSEAAAAVRARAEALSANGQADPAGTLRRWFGDDLGGGAARACRDWLTTVSPSGYQSAYTVFAYEDGPADLALAGLACPALFATGAHEPNSTPSMSRNMAALAPDGRAAVVADAAHMMPMTHPEAVNAELLAFFARCEGAYA